HIHTSHFSAYLCNSPVHHQEFLQVRPHTAYFPTHGMVLFLPSSLYHLPSFLSNYPAFFPSFRNTVAAIEMTPSIFPCTRSGSLSQFSAISLNSSSLFSSWSFVNVISFIKSPPLLLF